MGTLNLIQSRLKQVLSSNMERYCSSFGKDEDILVALLSGFNQVFLLYLFFAMTGSLIMGDHSSTYSPVPEDYNFELDSGLRRGAGHATSVTCMAVLSVVVIVWVGCSRITRNRRIVDLQFDYHGGRRH